MTDDQIVAAWLNEVHADTTRAAYARDLAAFRAWQNRTDTGTLLTLDRAAAGAYAAHVRSLRRAGRPLSPATQARKLSVVSSFYNHLVEAGHIPASPFHKLRRPKVSPSGQTPARDSFELAAMWDAAEGRDRVVVGLLTVSGLRVSELASANVRDLTTEHGLRVLSVRTKGGGRRHVPIPGPVLAELDTYLAGNPTLEGSRGLRSRGPLVLADDGGRLNRDKVTTILRRAARAAGIPDADLIRPHVLRASAITNLLEAGVPIQDVQAMVGHASADTTTRYWRRRAGIRRDAELADALATQMAGGCGKPAGPVGIRR